MTPSTIQHRMVAARRRTIMECLTARIGTGLGSPSIAELCRMTGMSKCVVHGDLMALQQLGYLRFGTANQSRAITVLVPFVAGDVATVSRQEVAA